MGEKLFTLSFDDGTEQDIRLIGLMERYGIKGTFNISSDPMHPELYVNHYILSEKEALRVYSSPNVEVASHGTHHLVQSDLTKIQAEEEITRDFRRLSELFGCRIFGHAFPKDTFNGNVIDALRQNGALYARRVSRQRPKDFSFDRSSLILMPTCRHCDPFADELLSEFISAPAGRDDMVFVMWGHSYELDYGTPLACWEHIERMFQALSRAKDIEFVTNRELYGA